MNFMLVPGWPNKNRTCMICGGKLSVKYDVEMKSNDKEITFPCCNVCLPKLFLRKAPRNKSKISK